MLRLMAGREATVPPSSRGALEPGHTSSFTGKCSIWAGRRALKTRLQAKRFSPAATINWTQQGKGRAGPTPGSVQTPHKMPSRKNRPCPALPMPAPANRLLMALGSGQAPDDSRLLMTLGSGQLLQRRSTTASLSSSSSKVGRQPCGIQGKPPRDGHALFWFFI